MNERDNERKPEDKKRKRIYLVIASAVLVIVLILIAVLLSKCGAAASDPENTESTSDTTGKGADTSGGEDTSKTAPEDTDGEPVHVHNFGDWTVLAEPSCTEPGERERTCASCGETQKEELAPLGHKGVNNKCVRCGKEAALEGLTFDTEDEYPDGYVLRSVAELTEEDVLLPDVYNGKPVLRISGNNTENNTVKRISVPDSVETVSDWAFAYFYALEGAHFGKNVKRIERAIAFYSGKLRWLSVDPENETYHDYCNCVIDTANKKLVLGCAGSVIPDDGSVEIIANSSLAHANFTSLVIPDGVKTVENYAVNDCNALVDLYISDSVTEVQHNAFAFCESLKDLRLSESLTVIENETFWGCKALESVVIPGNVKEIKYQAFEDCTSLKNVTLPEGLLSVYDSFRGCTSLENIDLPSTLTYIGDAFAGCTSLKKLVVPDSVERIGGSMVSLCGELKELVLPSGLERIERNNFYGLSSLESVTIPPKVFLIEEGAFVGCTNLRSVVLPKSLKLVSSGAFEECPELKTIYYEGSEEDWAAIKIYTPNDILTGAKIVYNYR